MPYRFEESEHYDTLSGLLAEQFHDKAITAGDVLDLKDYQVKVIKMYRNSVERAELKLTHLTEEEEENT